MFCVLTDSSFSVDSLSNISSVVCGGGGVFGPCFVMQSLASFVVVQSSCRKGNSWLLYIEFLMYWGSK